MLESSTLILHSMNINLVFIKYPPFPRKNYSYQEYKYCVHVFEGYLIKLRFVRMHLIIGALLWLW